MMPAERRPPRMGRCRWCGQPRVDLSRHPAARFCSKRCFGLWSAREGAFPLSPGSNEFNRGKAPRQERHWAWKGDRVSCAAALDRTRKLFPLLKACERCGRGPSRARITRHHRDRNRLNNDPSNIEFLCVPCHNREHWH